MRIVLCCHRFLPRFTGGVEIYTLRLAQALQGLGHEIHILTGEPLATGDLTVKVHSDKYENLPVMRLQYDYDRRSVTYRASYSDPAVTSHIKTVLQQLQPDIVHATSLSLLMAGTIEAAASLDIPLVHTAMDRVLVCRRGFHLKHDNSICSAREELHGCTVCMGPRNRFETWLEQVWKITPKSVATPLLPFAEQLVGKKADFVHAEESIRYRLDYLPQWLPKIERIIAPSTHTRDMFVLNHFPADKLIVSPYGIEAPEQSQPKLSSTRLRFGFIGRITFIKGLHLLLEAFATLPNQDKTQLTIYGDPDEKSKNYLAHLQRKAAHLPNVHFAGHLDNARIAEAYRQMDVLVFPSISPENSPLTVLEAQAYGVPVISSDVGGIADIIRHEENGLTFTNQNVESLVEQMHRCVESPSLVASLAGQSRLVKSIQQDAGEMVAVYQEIVNTRHYPNTKRPTSELFALNSTNENDA